MSVIDNYLNGLTNIQDKATLERIRQIVLEAAPGAQEVITYGMPGFRYNNHYLIAFCVFKDHLGLYPTAEPIEKLKDKLTKYSLSKGAIRFSADNPIPKTLIQNIVRVRMKTIDL